MILRKGDFNPILQNRPSTTYLSVQVIESILSPKRRPLPFLLWSGYEIVFIAEYKALILSNTVLAKLNIAILLSNAINFLLHYPRRVEIMPCRDSLIYDQMFFVCKNILGKG